jgi:hypothetical protein
MEKLNTYYQRSAELDAHLMTMGEASFTHIFAIL